MAKPREQWEKPGPSSNFKKELWEQAMGLIASGWTVQKVCDIEGMPSMARFFVWISKDPELRAQYELAKQAQLEGEMDKLLELTDSLTEGGTPDPADVNYLRLRVDTRKWAASKLLPNKYGDRSRQDVTVTVDHESILAKAIERMTKARG